MHVRATPGNCLNCLFVLFLLIGGFGTICSQYGWCTRPTAISTTMISFIGAGIIGFIDRNAHRADRLRNRGREGYFRRLLHYFRRFRRAQLPIFASTGATEPESPRSTPLELAQRHWASALRHASESSTDSHGRSRSTTPSPDARGLLHAPPWSCIVPTCPDSFIDLSIFIRHMAKLHADLLDADDQVVVATGTPLSAVWYLRELLRNNRPRAKERSVPKIGPDSEEQQLEVAHLVAPNSTAAAPARDVQRTANTIDATRAEARRRLVNIHDFGEQQWCISCGAPASFQDDAGRPRCEHCSWRYCSNACQLVDTQGFADDEDEN